MTTQQRRKDLKEKYATWERQLNERYEKRLAGLKAHYERMRDDITNDWRQELEAMHTARTEELWKLDGTKRRAR